ncbi:MAG TPA: hypothetical protein VNT22_03660 [Baekduia sp.]|nr:hypothetical protein [Baekduia sp.]
MLGTILLAAAEAGHEEPSKTAFYIVGIVLVLWAVAISAAGIRSNGFAASKASGAAVAAVTVILVAATMATTILTA